MHSPIMTSLISSTSHDPFRILCGKNQNFTGERLRITIEGPRLVAFPFQSHHPWMGEAARAKMCCLDTAFSLGPYL
jgi:hypothetical protein